MVRVLAPETSGVVPHWPREHGVPALLASLGDSLHDVSTVTSDIEENLPSAPPPPPSTHGSSSSGRGPRPRAVCRVLRAFRRRRERPRLRLGGGRRHGCGQWGDRRRSGAGRGSAGRVEDRGCSGSTISGRLCGRPGLAAPVITDGLAPRGRPGNLGLALHSRGRRWWGTQPAPRRRPPQARPHRGPHPYGN